MTCGFVKPTWGAISARGKKARTVHLLDLEPARWLAAGTLVESLLVGRHLAPRDCDERACILRRRPGLLSDFIKGMIVLQGEI